MLNLPRHVVGLSGGKDSTAMALRLHELNPSVDYEYICNWTGDEPPALLAHMALLERLLGKQVIRVTYTTDLYGLIEELQMLPNFRARWCTRILKIEPTIEYFSGLPKGSVLYVGLRADEELRQGLFGDDVHSEFPMREWGWSIGDVKAYLASRNICIPERTDCLLCPMQRLGEWRDLYYNNPDAYYRGVAIEHKHGHTFRSDGRDTWPASLAELAFEFESGRPLRERKADRESGKCRVCSF